MTVQEHLRIVKERWKAVAGAVLFGLAASIAAYFAQPTTYTATIQIFVASPSSPNGQSSAASEAQLAQDRVTSYSELATSPRVLAAVIRQRNLPLTVQQFADKVSASSTDKTVVLSVAVTDSSALRAADLANSVGENLRDTVDELEKPSQIGGSAPLTLKILEPAPVPTEQSIIGLRRLAGVGGLVGVAIGVALAFLRNAMDNTIKAVDEVSKLSNAPLLGSVSFESSVSKAPLIVRDNPSTIASEDYKKIRTNLQFVDAGNPHKVLLLTSSVPGEGKSVTTANIGLALASAGHRVLLIDADLRRPTLGKLLGIQEDVGLTNILAGMVTPTQVIQNTSVPTLKALAAGTPPPNPSELLGSDLMAQLVSDLRPQFDTILIDTSPLIAVTDAAALAPTTDGAILLCRANRTTRQQFSSALRALTSVDVVVRGTILTMTQSRESEPNSYNYPVQPAEFPGTPPTAKPVKQESPARTETIERAGLANHDERAPSSRIRAQSSQQNSSARTSAPSPVQRRG